MSLSLTCEAEYTEVGANQISLKQSNRAALYSVLKSIGGLFTFLSFGENQISLKQQGQNGEVYRCLLLLLLLLYFLNPFLSFEANVEVARR